MATLKKTIKQQYEEIIANYPLSDEHKEFLEGRIAMCDKKTVNRKPTERQIKNAEIAKSVYEFMVHNGGKYTVSDLMKKVPAFAEIEGISNQFATSIVKSLVDKKWIKRSEEKGKAYFEAVVEEA